MIKIFDNGGVTIDRFIVGIETKKGWDVYSMSKDPLSPVGVNRFMGTLKEFEPLKSETELSLAKISEEIKEAIVHRIVDIIAKI